ncbi:hypothetical protein [Streptomyces sp. DSM 40750]|uniref:hypothetical protein n=1 Tax=Streptomyces sp. DSM 40750 TaxID=2801030 RepID=UPI00214AAC10|nr:hypothetical protein [Streptomyces sp. DSM 40750]UUU24043.1 hypothetical protein JIX55_29380 [Streptomyces sp. DSM 40750]
MKKTISLRASAPEALTVAVPFDPVPPSPSIQVDTGGDREDGEGDADDEDNERRRVRLVRFWRSAQAEDYE